LFSLWIRYDVFARDYEDESVQRAELVKNLLLFKLLTGSAIHIVWSKYIKSMTQPDLV